MTVTEDEICKFFNATMVAAQGPDRDPGDSVTNVYLNSQKRYDEGCLFVCWIVVRLLHCFVGCGVYPGCHFIKAFNFVFCCSCVVLLGLWFFLFGESFFFEFLTQCHNKMSN